MENTIEPKKLEFLIAGEPVKARVYMAGDRAFTYLSGLCLEIPMGLGYMDELLKLLHAVRDEMAEMQRKEGAAWDE
jgi:hypothetical protein